MFGFMFFFPPHFFWGRNVICFSWGSILGWTVERWSWSLLGPSPGDWISLRGLPSSSPSGEPAEPNKGRD